MCMRHTVVTTYTIGGYVLAFVMTDDSDAATEGVRSVIDSLRDDERDYACRRGTPRAHSTTHRR
jgi:hypothetical protein